MRQLVHPTLKELEQPKIRKYLVSCGLFEELVNLETLKSTDARAGKDS